MIPSLRDENLYPLTFTLYPLYLYTSIPLYPPHTYFHIYLLPYIRISVLPPKSKGVRRKIPEGKRDPYLPLNIFVIFLATFSPVPSRNFVSFF